MHGRSFVPSFLPSLLGKPKWVSARFIKISRVQSGAERSFQLLRSPSLLLPSSERKYLRQVAWVEKDSRNLIKRSLTAVLPMSFFDRGGTFCMSVFYSFFRPSCPLFLSKGTFYTRPTQHMHNRFVQNLSQTCKRISQTLHPALSFHESLRSHANFDHASLVRLNWLNLFSLVTREREVRRRE